MALPPVLLALVQTIKTAGLPDGQINIDEPDARRAVQPLGEKYISSVFQKDMFMIRPSRLECEGRTRRHERGARDAMDASAPHDERRTRGRLKRVVPIPRRWDQVSRDDDPRGDGG
jgi:hypothetical protein